MNLTETWRTLAIDGQPVANVAKDSVVLLPMGTSTLRRHLETLRKRATLTGDWAQVQKLIEARLA